MRTALALSLGLLMSASSSYATIIATSHSADLPLSTITHKLEDAEYVIIPTKTEMRRIPNCTPNHESGETCIREIVLESKPMVQANVSYRDTYNQGEGQEKSYLMLRFELGDFDSGEVDLLRSAYPRWKHPFSNAPRKFAARNLELSVQKETRTIQVVDVGRSKLCRVQEDGSIERGCKEHIVYKDALTKVKEVTVGVK
jgi:hypothetical protein